MPDRSLICRAFCIAARTGSQTKRSEDEFALIWKMSDPPNHGRPVTIDRSQCPELCDPGGCHARGRRGVIASWYTVNRFEGSHDALIQFFASCSNNTIEQNHFTAADSRSSDRYILPFSNNSKFQLSCNADKSQPVILILIPNNPALFITPYALTATFCVNSCNTVSGKPQ